MEAIKVMIADDHSLIREGLRQLLEFDGSIQVVGEAANGVECLDNLVKYNPEVLLLDINMPEMNGIDVLKKMGHFLLEIGAPSGPSLVRTLNSFNSL